MQFSTCSTSIVSARRTLLLMVTAIHIQAYVLIQQQRKLRGAHFRWQRCECTEWAGVDGRHELCVGDHLVPAAHAPDRKNL